MASMRDPKDITFKRIYAYRSKCAYRFPLSTVRDDKAFSLRSERHFSFSYHVFLSFRGEDTRKCFTDHLYTALKWEGIRTFRDDDEIKRGENIELEIVKAIQESKVSIIVFSKDYASSRWCLDELVMIMGRREMVDHTVLPVFYDVNPSHVSEQIGSFAEAFVRHEECFKDEMDRVESWREALREAANLGGMVLGDRYESQFIHDIVAEVRHKLNRAILHVPVYLVGIDSFVEQINEWLQDRSTDVDLAIIYGTGGVGKTTIAKIVFNLNYDRFDSSSFIKDVRETSEQPNGLVKLQNQLLSNILKTKTSKIHNVDEGNVKIRDALWHKSVLVILDDVDHMDQFNAIIGLRDWFYQGSKIIITTRNKHLLRSHKALVKFFEVDALDDNESLRLFNWHAFGTAHPTEDYIQLSKIAVHHCGGIPLALEVLGSSLSGHPIHFWRRALLEPEAIDDGKIQRILRISYDSLQDNRDKNLFLDIACFFFGKDKYYLEKIIEGCDLYRIVGIHKLIDKCLITIDKDETVKMHQLLRDMGREIVRQESPEDPGKRSRLWRHKDALSVLRKNRATETVRSFIFDQQQNTASSNEVDMKTETLAKMSNLRLLHLNKVKLNGGFEAFPKGLVWLCWRGFPLNCIPNIFCLEDLIILDMCNSNLKQVFRGNWILAELKILDLSHSHSLVSTSDLSGLLNLERMILKDCINLIEVHQSIGNLQRLVLLNLKDCKSLKKLPQEIGLLESLDQLILSGCSNLDELPEELQKLKSLRVLHMDETARNQSQPWKLSCCSCLSPRESQQSISSLAFLPGSLVKLSLSNCNITDDVIPDDLSCLPSLEYLDLSGNPIHTLPESVTSLSKLESLLVNHCKSLQLLPELPTNLKNLWAKSCISLERIRNLPDNMKSLAALTSINLCHLMSLRSFPLPVTGSTRSKKFALNGVTWELSADCLNELRYPRLNLNGCEKLVQVQGYFNSEVVRDFDSETINNMHLFSVGSVEGIEVEMINALTQTLSITPPQVTQERGIFSIFLPGSEIPNWYIHQIESSSISFDVPQLPAGHKIRGLNLCIVLCNIDKKFMLYPQRMLYPPRALISNNTKYLKWSYSPMVYGVPRRGDEDMLWLSHWKFGDQLQSGDRVNISVVVTHPLQVKKCGIYTVCEHEKQDTIFNCEEVVQDDHSARVNFMRHCLLEYFLKKYRLLDSTMKEQEFNFFAMALLTVYYEEGLISRTMRR